MSWKPDPTFYSFFQLDPQRRNWRHTSDATDQYNCIAFAADDNTRRWWPVDGRYWPPGFPRVATLENFVATFSKWLGYKPCTSEECEPGKEKIAIFVDAAGIPTHAAKQLEGDGWWKSKLGDNVDIEHELRAVEGRAYGKVRLIMSRGRWGRFRCRCQMAFWAWRSIPLQ